MTATDRKQRRADALRSGSVSFDGRTFQIVSKAEMRALLTDLDNEEQGFTRESAVSLLSRRAPLSPECAAAFEHLNPYGRRYPNG